MRSPDSVEVRVAVTIATNVEYRTLSALFGLGRYISPFAKWQAWMSALLYVNNYILLSM